MSRLLYLEVWKYSSFHKEYPGIMIRIHLRSQMDVPGMVMTSSSEPVLKSVGGRRVVNEPQKLHRKIKDNRITAEYLREHCRRHDLYMTPRFNTVLYLHHKVMSNI